MNEVYNVILPVNYFQEDLYFAFALCELNLIIQIQPGILNKRIRLILTPSERKNWSSNSARHLLPTVCL